jgi:hypothetical protein
MIGYLPFGKVSSEGDYSAWPGFISFGTQLLNKGFKLCPSVELFDVLTVFVVTEEDFSVFNPRRVVGETFELVGSLGHDGVARVRRE